MRVPFFTSSGGGESRHNRTHNSTSQQRNSHHHHQFHLSSKWTRILIVALCQMVTVLSQGNFVSFLQIFVYFTSLFKFAHVLQHNKWVSVKKIKVV